MSKINDGGPAFSCPEDESNMRNKGMSLRDYFAAKAMQAWFTDHEADFDDPKMQWMAAKYSYMIADAMLKVRQK